MIEEEEEETHQGKEKAQNMSQQNVSDQVKFSIGENNETNNGGGVDESHRPHQLFCEMDELQSNYEWKEAARWLKFEEDVENGGRWSKPHVATLSLHSLFELRSCLTNGAVLLDFAGDDITTIVDHLLESVVHSHLLNEEHREQVRNALLLKHVHQHEKEFQKQLNNGEKKSFPLIRSLADMGKKASNVDFRDSANASPLAMNNSSFLNANEASKQSLKQSSTQATFDLGGSTARMTTVDSKPKDLLVQIGSSVSVASNMSYKINQNFMKKIPQGAEASNVLVGEVDFLDYQFSAFVRLSKGVILGDFTEVPVPTRFLFVILGPKGNLPKYHEIGRSISTLMSDELFHEVAYKAKNKHELLNAFDLFLDQVTVLPPGEWDPNIRLDPPKKVPLKEERLERIAEAIKLNGSLSTIKKEEEEVGGCHGDDPGLVFTGRFCGGLVDDIKRKAPWLWSDFKDGLNFQCLSSILFMYFACLSPIITFGGLLGTATDGNMSAIESLLSGAVCGILYSLFAGQPMTILGSTGPVLVFETILNTFSKEYGIDYMGFRAWIGLWTAFILIVIVVTDCSALVKYITRFTEESFAALIAFIFIKESIFKLIEIKNYKKYSTTLQPYIDDQINNISNCVLCVRKKTASPLGANSTLLASYASLSAEECAALGPDYMLNRKCDYVPDVFFVSVFLYLLTFCLAMTLRSFRTSRFFPSFVRSKVADFGVVITIGVAVGTDIMLGFETPKLMVPLKFENTIPNRGWFINPLERNKDKLWLAAAAIIPSLLATILIFMDQHITAVIINRKENKLNKGGGYHLDMLIVAITIAINSLLGIPWFVAATVLSINHVLSLKKESEASAPGEKPKFLGVIEQRVTGTIVFVLIGCSVFLAQLLRKIPMPVLYGVFLYMGISSLNGIQFMHRLILVLMPEKHQPDYIFLRHVRTIKVHFFTLIQISSLAMLFLIKSNKTTSILFPIMVLALVGIRKLMDYMFTQKELSYLDDIMPEIIKRSKEDKENGVESNPSLLDKENSDDKIVRNESINISQEISKTHIWQDLVNSDKQLALEREKARNHHSHKKGGFSMSSLKLRHHHNHDDQHAAAAAPLLSHQSSQVTKSPNNQSVLSSDSSANNNIVPTIVIENNCNSPVTTPTGPPAALPTHDSKTDYYKNRKEFFSTQSQSKV